MNTTFCNRIHHRDQAFSLVEVVLAIAIVAIGLVAILGLFPQGLTSGQNAADDSLLAVIVQDVIAQRKIYIQNYPNQIGLPDLNQPYWFLPDGSTTTAANANTARYKCEMFCGPVTGIPNLETNQVRVLWPWFQASGNNAYKPLNTNSYFTQIAAYQ